MNRPVLYALATCWLLMSSRLFAAEALFLLGPQVSAQSTAGHPANSALKAILDDQTTVQVNQLTLDAGLLTTDMQELAFPLEEGLVVVASKFQAEFASTRLFTWHGRLPDQRMINAGVQTGKEVPVDELNSAILVRNGDQVSGSIHYLGQLYQIVPVGVGEHVIVKVDTSKYPEDLVLPVDPPLEHSPAAPTSTALSAIRVLLIYTNQAKAAWPDMEGHAALMFAEANQGMAHSDVPIYFESAGVYHLDYSDKQGTDGYSQMLVDLRTPTHAALGGPVSLLREQQRADLVVMVSKASIYCGLAYVNAPKGYAFSIVSCPTGNYTFAHEMGHNFGLNHYSDVPAGQYGDGFGYQQKGHSPFWRTTMAYDCIPACPRGNYWSSPNRTYNGLPMGIAGIHNSVRVLNLRREVLANFYPPLEAQLPVGQLEIPLDVEANQTFVARAIATDPGGSTLDYAWSAPGFTPEVGSADSLSLKAPNVAQPLRKPISVKLTNAYGTTLLNKTLTIRPAIAPITATMDIPPTVIAGGQLPVKVDAYSSTDKPLTYAWSRTAGMYTGTTGGRPSGIYTAADVDKDTNTTIYVTVSDGTNEVKRSSSVVILTALALCAAPWEEEKIYATVNEKASYAGYNYEVAHWTQRQRPDLNAGPEGKPWRKLSSCSH